MRPGKMEAKTNFLSALLSNELNWATLRCSPNIKEEERGRGKGEPLITKYVLCK
jgi:hypothetical protein